MKSAKTSPKASRPTFPASKLIGSNNLVETVRKNRRLLALAAAVEVDELPPQALEGLKLILEQALETFKQVNSYLEKEQRVCELWRDGTEERP